MTLSNNYTTYTIDSNIIYVIIYFKSILDTDKKMVPVFV